MFYALTDRSTGDNPAEHTSGFANTKEAIAFPSKAARDAWLADTKLLTAKAITHDEALSITGWEDGDYRGKKGCFVKAVRLHGTEESFHIIASK
ncbi:MAG: hypothetical protein K2Y10_05725 [Burkholderiaceae bacterium]|nr:hypothetical protein [Burkholderiaceae bacterium]